MSSWTMNSLNALPARWDWPSALGNFILAFGHLDYLVFAFLKDNLPPEAFSGVRDMHFKDRMQRVRRILESSTASNGRDAEFELLAHRIEPLRHLRNSIAHGHLLVDAGGEQSPPTVMLGNPKNIDLAISDHAHVIKLEDIVNASILLQGVIDDFQNLVGFTPAITATSPDGRMSASMFSQRRPD